jgi:hypothetical protein
MTMMKKHIAAAVLAVSVVGGVGTGVLADAMTTESSATADPQRTTSPTPTPSASLPPEQQGGEVGVPPGDVLELAPGAVGPVRVGMSKSEALATGYFVADVPSPAEGCPDRELSWKDEYVNTYDVQTLGNGEITSIGVRGEGIVTADGIGPGSTLDEVRAQYPDEELVEAGYGQSGIRFFDPQDGGWIGFLFEEPVDSVQGSDEVFFVEVTQGAEPSLMRDGC